MKLRSWLADRNPEYLLRKAQTLLRRYGISEGKAVKRTEAFIQYIEEHDGAASAGPPVTLFAPGLVLERYPDAIRRLQETGIEIGVHGWEHVDLRSYPVDEARAQLLRAVQGFERHSLGVHGFRCPYLSHSDALVNSIPSGFFEYSSNAAVWWDVISSADLGKGNAVYEATISFYAPKASDTHLSVPWQRANLIEIPVSLPDDMLLFDGIFRNVDSMARAWHDMMLQTYRRGELFNLIFHPELADREQEPFVELLTEARQLDPPIWSARLCDISAWWIEKRRFRAVVNAGAKGVRVNAASGPAATMSVLEPASVATAHYSVRGQEVQAREQLQITFENCTPRATILVRGLEATDMSLTTEPWSGPYRRLRLNRPGGPGDGAAVGKPVPTPILSVPAEPRPFVGVTSGVPGDTVMLLREMGYIVETGSTQAKRCGVVIDERILEEHPSDVALVAYIEATTAPLVRFWPWPNGARSALCFSGDLDALSLTDYAGRLFSK